MYRFLLVAVLVAAIPGCYLAQSGPMLVKVSGVITFYGEPLAGASVMYVPVQARDAQRRFTPISMGVTDDQGRYQLSVSTGDPGAIAGEHRVLVSKIMLPDKMRAEESVPQDENSSFTAAEKATQLRRSYVFANPFSYGQPMGEVVFDSFNLDSQLYFEVPTGGTSNADFDVGQDPLLADD